MHLGPGTVSSQAKLNCLLRKRCISIVQSALRPSSQLCLMCTYMMLHLVRPSLWDCLEKSFLATLPLLLASAEIASGLASSLPCTHTSLAYNQALLESHIHSVLPVEDIPSLATGIAVTVPLLHHQNSEQACRDVMVVNRGVRWIALRTRTPVHDQNH